MPESISFIPGRFPISPRPLARYLPPLPEGIANTWLKNITVPSQAGTRLWVLDPFGASPALVKEAARAGYCVLVVTVNPVTRFLLEMAAQPPSEDKLRAAIADLGATPTGDERLEPFINSLYKAECDQCEHTVTAEAFVWEHGATGPLKRIYHCQFCGKEGEFPSTPDDINRAEKFSRSGLHHARALERVADVGEPERERAEEALATYLPRSLYALFTLLNKIEGKPQPQQRLLKALLLTACDRANTLWQYPTTRARPRRLTIPPQFYEYNIWNALEEAITQWASPVEDTDSSLPLTLWPELPPDDGGICLYEGRLEDFADAFQTQNTQQITFKAVLTAVPRLNQAFWTLSALWAGWLWGRSASAQYRGVLRRRRFDWAWHTGALHTTIKHLANILDNSTPILGLIGELEPGFLSSTILSAELANLRLSGIALREEDGQAQIHWRMGSEAADTPAALREREFDEKIIEIIENAALKYLADRGQPANYNYIHAAALIAAALSRNLLLLSIHTPADVLGKMQNLFHQALVYSGDFVRFGGSKHSLEVGKWWLSDEGRVKEIPLIDRIEKACKQYLTDNPDCTSTDLEKSLCECFPGLLTPNPEEIKICLESYGQEAPSESGRWRLRSQDEPKTRAADLMEIQNLLTQIGSKLGYQVRIDSEQVLFWVEQEDQLKYHFQISTSGIIGEALSSQFIDCPHSLLVIPGGRANLLAYKLQSNPRLSQIINSGWRIVKFRQIRRLAEDLNLTRNNLDEQLGLDPPHYSDPQIPLF